MNIFQIFIHVCFYLCSYQCPNYASLSCLLQKRIRALESAVCARLHLGGLEIDPTLRLAHQEVALASLLDARWLHPCDDIHIYSQSQSHSHNQSRNQSTCRGLDANESNAYCTSGSAASMQASSGLLAGLYLRVGDFYSLRQDGTLCVPWNALDSVRQH